MNVKEIIIDNIENIDYDVISHEDLEKIIEEWGIKEDSDA